MLYKQYSKYEWYPTNGLGDLNFDIYLNLKFNIYLNLAS